MYIIQYNTLHCSKPSFDFASLIAYFQEMINCKLNAVLIKVAALGLVPKLHLGKSLAEMKPTLLKLVRYLYQLTSPGYSIHGIHL